MTEPVPPNDKKKVIPAFSEQCFLVDFIDVISGWKGVALPQKYNNLILTDPKTPHSGLFLNKLLSTANAQEFLDDLPRVVSSDLKPNVEIFKVIGDREYRLPLAGARDELDFSETQQDAVSLKSFNWNYLGTQPAEVDYFIDCNMVLHFASAEAFFKEYEVADKDSNTNATRKAVYSFRDLIVRRRTNQKDEQPVVAGNEHLEYDPKAFRIKAKISYRADINAMREKFGGNAARAQKFRDFLQASTVELFLTLKKHTFTPLSKQVTETSFDLSIDYNGAVENAFLMPKSNILIPPLSGKEQKKAQDAKKRLEELTISKLKGLSLTSEQAERVSRLSLEKLEGNEDIDDLEVKVFGKDSTQLIGTSDQEKKAEAILEFLKEKAGLEKEVQNVIMSEQKQLDAYGRVIRKLHQQKKIYHMNIRNDDLSKWFSARADFEQVSPAKLEIMRKNVRKNCNPPDGGTPSSDECKKAKDELEAFLKKQSDYGLALRDLNDFIQAAGPPVPAEKNNEQRDDLTKKVNEAESQTERDEAIDSYKKELIEMDAPLSDSGTRPVMFFYYGDLLDAVIDFLQEYRTELGLDIWGTENPEGKLKFLLGNIEYNHPKTNEPRTVNLAKVPISLELWDQWWLDRVIRPQRENYLFKAFLRDSMSTLVKNAFTNRCKIRGQVLNKINVNIDHVPIKNSDVRLRCDKGVCYYTYLPKSITEKPTNEQRERSGVDGEIVFIYAPSNNPGYLRGEKQEDNKSGIYHISAVGGENKPIKSIDFTKTDQPFFLEAKAEKSGILDDDIQMSEPYNCSFAAFGHTVWRPGKYIYMYFPLSWFSKKQSMMLGLGGYYLMTKASNYIQRTGKRYTWDSQIECKWETFANTNPKPVSNELSDVEAPPTPPKLAPAEVDVSV